MFDFCHKLQACAKIAQASLEREGDVVISRFRRESSLQALENAVKAAKRAQADENAVSSEENGDTEGTATKVRAKRARKRGSAPRRASELLAIFGYITEINGILNDMDFSPRENGLNSPFLLAVSGPKRELILKTLLDESQQNDALVSVIGEYFRKNLSEPAV